jgi:DNA repair protein RadC
MYMKIEVRETGRGLKPSEEKPREMLYSRGPEFLSDKQLLALLLGWGTKGKSVYMLAEEVLGLIDHSRSSVAIEELIGIPGLGKAKAAVIAAALEFSRRRLCPRPNKIAFPSDVLPLIRHFADRKQEHFLCISLNGAHEVTAIRVVSVGLVNRALVHPREVFADPLTDRAASVIVCHNHPSGQVDPSREDREVTARLKAAGTTLGIQLLDHIIFSVHEYFSFLEADEL